MLIPIMVPCQPLSDIVPVGLTASMHTMPTVTYKMLQIPFYTSNHGIAWEVAPWKATSRVGAGCDVDLVSSYFISC